MQKLQNSTIRKILRFFRIASIETLKIKSNISSIEIRMHRKMQKYALRTMKVTKNYSIRSRTSIFYSSKYQNEIFDENEKKHASQINRILNIMISHINQTNIENNEISIKSWKEMKHWSELKIYRFKIRQLKIHRKNWKKIKNKNADEKSCKFVKINFQNKKFDNFLH